MANRIHETKTFPAGETKAATAFCLHAVSQFAKAYRAEGAEVYETHNGHEMRTDGGDWVRADWDWDDVDDQASPITAKVYGSH